MRHDVVHVARDAVALLLDDVAVLDEFALAIRGLLAADLAEPSVVAAPEMPLASEPGPWMIRARALAVLPDDKASLSLNGAALNGEKVGVSNSVVPELDITYFFTDNIAAELILGTTPHTARGSGSIASLGEIGKAWLLPPTLTLQYHFNATETIKPYIGAGVNYTVFYSEEPRGDFSSFNMKNTFGVALQAGVDIKLDEHWGLNFDVKKLFLEPEVNATLPGAGAVSGKVKLDPWLIGTGISYRF